MRVCLPACSPVPAARLLEQLLLLLGVNSDDGQIVFNVFTEDIACYTVVFLVCFS